MGIAESNQLDTIQPSRFLSIPSIWKPRYARIEMLVDGGCALLGGLIGLICRFDGRGQVPQLYVATTLGLPAIWVAWMALAGGYDVRLIGVGSDEYRRVLNAAVSLTAAVAIISYAADLQLARGYVVIALPAITLLDLVARYRLRKTLHRQNTEGRNLRRVAVVGHAAAAAELILHLRRERHHGLEVVAVCLPDSAAASHIEGVPVRGGFDEVAHAVRASAADTVAVLTCPELCGGPLRQLAWTLEKTSTELYLAPALLDVAGPRTTIRPVAGLPLLHVDHPELGGAKRLIKGLFDRLVAASAMILLSPLLVLIGIIIRLHDGDRCCSGRPGWARTDVSSRSTSSARWWRTRNVSAATWCR